MNTPEENEQFRELSVFIIEDDLILTLSLELMLKKMGFRKFFRAETGERAIELSKKTKPDLLLVDICLGPGISGVDAVRKIQDSSPAPVIYITGNSDDRNRSVAEETNYVDYLVKPITPVEVRRSIEKIWAPPVNGNG